MTTKTTQAPLHDKCARGDHAGCRFIGFDGPDCPCPCHEVVVDHDRGEFADDPRVKQVTNTYFEVGETGRCLFIGVGLGYSPLPDLADRPLPAVSDSEGWWLALDDGVEVGEYEGLVDALRALLGPADSGGRRRRFWTTVRTLLRGSMWLTYAVGLWSLVAQADQLAGAALAAVAGLLFAGAAALASLAEERGRNHG